MSYCLITTASFVAPEMIRNYVIKTEKENEKSIYRVKSNQYITQNQTNFEVVSQGTWCPAKLHIATTN